MNEQENTMRALADKPPLITSWLCYFGIHSWTQWGEWFKNKSDRAMQDRHCRHCSKKQLMYVKSVNTSY